MEFLNGNTRASLDMDYIFNMITPRTPYGSALKRDIKPFGIDQFDALEKEYDETSDLIEFINSSPDKYAAIAQKLSEVKEIRQSIKRATEGMVLDEFEFFELKSLMLTVAELVELQRGCDNLSDNVRLFRLEDVEDLLDPDSMRQRAFYIYDSYSRELMDIRDEKRNIQRQIDTARKNLTQRVEEKVLGKLKLSGEIIILKKDEERLKNARACNDLTEGASTMLQVTFKLKNNTELIALLEKLEEIRQKEGNEEYFIKKRLSNVISENSFKIYELIGKLGKLDFFMARAEFSKAIGGNRPILHCHDKILIKKGRHIRLEQVLAQKGMEFCPASFEVHRGVTVITGANMGGKTVNLKLAGMLTAMAQYGLFVPAEEFHTCLMDFIYFSIGDMQSIDSGLSTFGSEILGMIEILRLSHKKGLVLIDELARGTNPEEGYAISRAIVHYLNKTNSFTLFTTHFDGISSEKDVKHLRVKGLKQVDYDKIGKELATDASKDAVGTIDDTGLAAVLKHMDYSLIEVVGDGDGDGDYEVPRDAINIAKLMGIDQKILDYAEKIMVKRKGDYNGKVTLR